MKGLGIIATLTILTCIPSAGKDYAKLDSLLAGFYEALTPESIETKNAEFDNLIGMCKDSLTRQHIAIQIFEHYREPLVMGDEDVAFHIYDFWLSSGKIPFPGEMYKLDADLYIDFNRSNLIGCTAPGIALFSPGGKSVGIPSKDRASVLYFYDTSCGKCKLESKVLPGILQKVDFKIDFYAIYCGQSLKEWKKFRKEFKTKNKNIRLIHLEDRKIESDYLRLYGVISTPRLFVVEKGGLIVGRRLEAENLIQALAIAKEIQMSYEKEEFKKIDPEFLRKEIAALKRNHIKSVCFNEREIAAIDEYCRRFKVRSRSALIRQATMECILKTLGENQPSLFE